MRTGFSVWKPVVGAITALVVLASAHTAFSAEKKIVRVAIPMEVSSVNVNQLKLGVDILVNSHLHEALLGKTYETGEWSTENMLAESIEVLDSLKDIKVVMRKNARFHNGTPVTAHDVKFSYDQCVDPRNGSFLAGPLDEIEDIEIVDDYTLIFHFYEPYAPWRDLLSIGITSKKYFEEAGPEKFSKAPIGSGSFKFVKWDKGVSITLQAVKDHPTRVPEYDFLQFVIVSDPLTQVSMLETGELDLIHDIQPHQLRRLKKNKNVVIKRNSEVPSLFGVSFAPLHYPVVGDSNFGRAVRYGINRQEIVDKIFLGEGYPLYRFASRAELGHDPDKKFDYSPELAREYLAKSSYKPGTEIILTYTNSVANSNLVAVLIQKYLSKIGIKIKLQKLEEGVAATYVRKRDKRLGHLRIYRWDGSADPNMRLLLTIPSTAPYTAVTNRPRKAEVDALVIAQSHEMDQEKRIAMLNKLHKILEEDSVGTILFGLNKIYAMNKRIDYTWPPTLTDPFHLSRVKIKK